MFSIVYLEEKVLTRTAYQYAFESQADCKVIYNSGDLQSFCDFLQKQTQPPDLCIVSDCYHYIDLVHLIKTIKAKSNHTYILLKSDAKFMKGICYLMKNGLHGIFFTDEPLIDLKACVRQRTRFNLSADKSKLITSNVLGSIQIKELNYNNTPLTQNEIEFIQACAKDQSYEEIATALHKSVNTIYDYRDRVFKKVAGKTKNRHGNDGP